MTSAAELAVNLRKAVNVRRYCERVGGKSGRIRPYWNGTHVSPLSITFGRFLPFITHTAWFRLFVGDLSNDVSDDILANAFNKYPSFQKARVIRDRLSQKVTHPVYSSLVAC